MRIMQTPPALLSLLFLALSHTSNVRAIPLLQELGFGFLEERTGTGNCGAQLQYTCYAGEGCFTSGTVAYCSTTVEDVAASTDYAVYTTTYTETDLVLRTSTYTSSWQPAATSVVPATYTTAAPAICSVETASCGAYCCASTQVCLYAGSCTDRVSSLWSYTAMPAPTVTSTYSSYSPYSRPTSGGVSTSTTTQSVSTTVPFIPVATASGSTLPITSHSTGGGLSGGAIAGIVIGTIAGIILLLLICFCCIVKAGFDGLLALFGFGKRRRRTERIETVERYSRHGSGTASRRDTHTGWFGRPARVDETRKKKSGGFGGLGAVGAGLVGLAVILGLKRRHDRKEKARSDISSSYYTDSYTGTSASSASSDRRTRDSRRSRPHR